MATTTITPKLDLDALKLEISQLSPDEVAKQLLDVRVKQRVQQKKYHNTDAAKAYRTKRAERIKMIAAQAKATPATLPGYANLYEQIKDQANKAADEQLGMNAGEADAIETDE
jgi:hypothetical protein